MTDPVAEPVVETSTPAPDFKATEPITEKEQVESEGMKDAIDRAEEGEAEAARRSEEKILDLPINIKVGKSTYPFTGRPIGVINIVKDELLAMSTLFKDIGSMAKDAIADADIQDPNAPPVTEADIKDMFTKSEEGLAILIKITQLLLEPTSYNEAGMPQPPDRENPTVSAEEIKWGMTAPEFARLLSLFVARDLLPAGMTVKNLMGLGR